MCGASLDSTPWVSAFSWAQVKQDRLRAVSFGKMSEHLSLVFFLPLAAHYLHSELLKAPQARPRDNVILQKAFHTSGLQITQHLVTGSMLQFSEFLQCTKAETL